MMRAALLALVFTGCATIQHGPMQRIRVDSEPVAATIRTHDCGPGSTKAARTAGIVWVNRRATRCALTISAPGFEPQTVRLQRVLSHEARDNARIFAELCDGDALDCNSFSDVVAAVFLGGIFAGTGFGVDAATGAMVALEPNDIHVTLVEAPP
jgi:hypothetical protein